MAEREIRIKMEFVVTTKQNVAQVRDSMREGSMVPPHATSLLEGVKKSVQNLTGARDPAKITCCSASYNTRYGRKDGKRR